MAEIKTKKNQIKRLINGKRFQKKEIKFIQERLIVHKEYIFIQKLIFLFIISFLSKGYYSSSNITLKINKTGNVQVYYPYNLYYGNVEIDEVYINDAKQNEVKSQYYFTNNTINTVKLVWNRNIKYTYRLFSGCSDIIEINLTNFDSSHVTDMSYMFEYCFSLSILDLSNLKTSNVKYMDYLFYDCYKLTSLDLSNFDTSKVI